jgi:pimeloyl-ACP methyl ester carboxylesterase
MPDAGWSEDVRRYGAEEERLFEAGDLDGAADLTVRFWVDGEGREPEQVDAAVRQAVHSMQRDAYANLVDAAEVEEQPTVEGIAGRVGEITAPTLLILGDHDRADIRSVVERLHAAIPGSQLERIAGAAHIPNMEQPERFNDLVLGFLDQVQASGRQAGVPTAS